MKKHLIIFSLLCSGIIQACGFEFQNMLLHNRQSTLLKSPIGMFEQKIQTWANSYEALNLPLDADDGLPNDWGQRDGKDDNERTVIEAKYLSVEQLELVKQARVAKNFEEAEEILSTVSGSFVEYTLAVRNPQQDELNDFPVLNRYNSVPKPEVGLDDEPWRLWGLYMLGKTQFRQNHYAAAIETFDQVQNLVIAGLSDPLHVAADSLGHQAMAYYYNDQFDKATKNYLRLVEMKHSYATFWLKDYARRLVFSISQLYWRSETEEENQYHKKRLHNAIKQPLTRRLLITYAYTHLGIDYHSMLRTLMQAYENETPGTQIEEADELAAYAYRLGHYENAEQLVKFNDSQLSQLIKAKLLLRKGEVEQAKTIYSNLVKYLKQASTQELNSEQCDIIAGASVLALSDGNIEQAFDLLVNHTGGEYWQDITYLAENLITLDTLVEKITTIAGNSNLNVQSKIAEYGDSLFNTQNVQGKYVAGIQNDFVKGLQYLTARRLIREGRPQEAMDLLPNERLQQRLQTYLNLQSKINTATDRKPELTFALAEWMIDNGSRILAFEGAPDYLMYNLQYTPYYYEDDEYYDDEDEGIEESQDNEDSVKLDWLNPIETKLLNQNTTYPNDSRFSYRYKAVELARSAAQMLPTTDPNFENYLCNAAKWVINDNQPLGYEIFKQFVNGAKPTEERKYFGVKCNTVSLN